MRKIKCINNENGRFNSLTVGKVYDVLEYPILSVLDEAVYIINDFGRRESFYMHLIKLKGSRMIKGDPIFIPIELHRNDVISKILK